MIRASRWIMFAVTVLTLVAVAAWSGAWLGPLGAVTAPLLLLTNPFFRTKMIEVRPDVPATLLFVLACLALARGVDLRRWRIVCSGGVLFAAAGLFTPKPIFGAAGAVLGGAWALLRANPSRWRVDAARYGAAVLGGALSAGAIVAIALLAAGNLRGFVDDCIVLGSQVRVNDVEGLRDVVLIQALVRSPGFWLLVVAGALLPTGRAPAGNAWVLRGAILGGAAGVFVINAPLHQYYLTVIAPGALLGARAIAALTSPEIRGTTAAKAVPMRVRTRILAGALVAAAAVASSAPALRYTVENSRRTMQAQLQRMSRILALTRPGDRVLDHWTGLYLTRLPAYHYFYLNSDILRLIPRQRLEDDLTRLLDEGRLQLYIPDPHSRLLPPTVLARLQSAFSWDAQARVFYTPIRDSAGGRR
jgi:hypothetical protein